MNLTVISVIGIIAMVLLIFSGMNIGMAMFTVGFFGYATVVNFKAAFGLLKTVPFSNAFNYSFTVIPLFILMGQFAFHSGLSADLFDAAEKWLGGVKGGLAAATVAACAGFSAICGSSGATSATMGVVAYPEMKKHGYSQALSAGSIAAGGTLGILIPPSTAFIMYGIIMSQSIGRLFAAGIIPGILLAICYILTIFITTHFNPKLAPATSRYTWKERFVSLKGCIALVVLFLAVIGGMFAGLFTPTEAAAVGAMLALLSVVINKRLKWEVLRSSLIETIATVAMAMFILISAMVFGYFLAITQLPQKLSGFVNGLDMNPYVIIFIIFLIYVVLGSFMDGLAMLLLTAPVFLPVVVGFGFSPIWFGVFVVLVQEMGMMTPPVGINVCIVAGTLKEVPLQTIFRGLVPFLGAVVVVVFLIVAFPSLATWLPDLIYG